MPKHKSRHDYIVTVTITTDAEVTKKDLRYEIEDALMEMEYLPKTIDGKETYVIAVTKVRVNRVDRQ